MRAGGVRGGGGSDHAAGRSYRIFRYNVFHHIGHISTLAQPTNRYNPGCYALLYDWLLPAEVFNDKECPDDDVWPCREAPHQAPAFFPRAKLSWSASAWKATPLSPDDGGLVGLRDGLGDEVDPSVRGGQRSAGRMRSRLLGGGEAVVRHGRGEHGLARGAEHLKRLARAMAAW